MLAIRRLLARRHLAALFCAAALVLKLLIPAGYMIASDRGRPTIAICPGGDVAGVAAVRMHGGMPGHGQPRDHGKAELPCAFAGLSAAALGAIDPVQLAVLVAFVMALGLLPVLPMPAARRVYLRPPLRGPPLPL